MKDTTFYAIVFIMIGFFLMWVPDADAQTEPGVICNESPYQVNSQRQLDRYGYLKRFANTQYPLTTEAIRTADRASKIAGCLKANATKFKGYITHVRINEYSRVAKAISNYKAAKREYAALQAVPSQETTVAKEWVQIRKTQLERAKALQARNMERAERDYKSAQAAYIAAKNEAEQLADKVVEVEKYEVSLRK